MLCRRKTCRRSSGISRAAGARGGAPASEAPHPTQNFAPGCASAPQPGQARASGLPQAMQKRAASGFSVEQTGQIRGEPIRIPAYAGAGTLATAR